MLNKPRSNFKFVTGLTLIELLIYIAVSAIILTMGSLILMPLLRNETRFDVKKIVESSVDSALETITRSIRSAQDVTTILPSGSNIRLTMSNQSKNPTRFRLNRTIQASGTEVLGAAWNEDVGDIFTSCKSADAVPFDVGENNLESIVNDGTYAYFGVRGSQPGKIVKVRISDFTLVGALDLTVNEDDVKSGIIDTANGFAYFGLGTSPGKIIKVRLSDFTRVGALTLQSGENNLSSAVIDTVNGFAYFGTITAPGRVVKIRLSDFSRVGAIILAAGNDNLGAAAIDVTNGYAYFGTEGTPGIVVKIHLSDLTNPQNLTLQSSEGNLGGAVLDTLRGFAYFGTFTNTGYIVKINVQNPTIQSMARVTSLLVASSGDFLGESAAIDSSNNFAYFVDYANVRVYKINIQDPTFSLAAYIPLTTQYTPPLYPPPGAVSIDSINNDLYIGSSYNYGTIWKVDLGIFSQVAVQYFDIGVPNGNFVVLDSSRSKIYAGLFTAPGKILEFDQAKNQFFAEHDFDIFTKRRIGTMQIDPNGNYLYSGFYSSYLTKISLPSFQIISDLNLGYRVFESAIDSNYLYVALANNSANNNLRSIALNTFTVANQVDSDYNYEFFPDGIALDTNNNYLYVGFDSLVNGSALSRVVKVQVPNMAIIGRISLPGIYYLSNHGGTIDTRPGQGYVYFGGEKGQIVKIRLSDFTLQQTIQTDPSVFMQAATIDTQAGYLYYASDGSPSKIYKIDLSNFSVADTLTLDNGDSNLTSGVIDQTRKLAYFTSYTNPTRIVIIDLTTFKKVTSAYSFSQCGLSNYNISKDSSNHYSGQAWNSVLGWINFCGNAATSSCSSPTYQVTEDSSNNLQGWGWNDIVGWISFNCTNTATCGTVSYKVSRDSNGYLTGNAWNNVIGYIKFGGKGGQIFMKEGTTDEKPLTDPAVNYSQINFTQVINPGAPKSVYIDAILNYISSKAEEQYSTERQTTAGLRNK